MTLQTISIGPVNGGQGDTPFSYCAKINANFSELYTLYSNLLTRVGNQTPIYTNVTINGSTIVGVGTAPGTVAAGDDPRIIGSLQASVAASTYAPLASPAFTGTPTVPTAALNTNTTQVASTAFVQAAVAGATGGGVSSASLDNAFGATRGGILERGASGWTNLPPGTAGYVLTSNGAGADPSYQAPPGGMSIPLGQCRLVYTNASTLTLKPYNGNQITIGGIPRTIPSAGVTLAGSGLSAGTLYFVYAYWTGSAIALEASGTAHATDAVTGMEVKSGDATRMLIGMIYVVNAGAFTDAPAQRLVASWFNRQPRHLAGSSNSGSTSSGSYTEISSSSRVAFVSFGDAVSLSGGGATTNSAQWINYVSLAIDGSIIGFPFTETIVSPNNPFGVSLSAAAMPTEGYHYGTGLHSTSNGMASTSFGLTGIVVQ